MISERVKKVRKYTGLSQKEFGERLGVSRDVITNIEYNRVEPKSWFIDHLCNSFLISKEWLLTGSGEMVDASCQTKNRTQIAIEIINELDPNLQDFALKQLRGILELQKSQKDANTL